jgi:hypothetical protein
MGDVPVTDATAAPAAMPSNFNLSAALNEPAVDVVAASMLIVGVVPPVDTMGDVPATDATKVGLFRI